MLRFCAFGLSTEQKPANLYKNIGKMKSPLDNLFGKKWRRSKRMRRRKINKIGDSSIGLHIRNTAGIMPNWCYIRSIADIPKLYAIVSKRLKGEINLSLETMVD